MGLTQQGPSLNFVAHLAVVKDQLAKIRVVASWGPYVSRQSIDHLLQNRVPLSIPALGTTRRIVLIRGQWNGGGAT